MNLRNQISIQNLLQQNQQYSSNGSNLRRNMEMACRKLNAHLPNECFEIKKSKLEVAHESQFSTLPRNSGLQKNFNSKQEIGEQRYRSFSRSRRVNRSTFDTLSDKENSPTKTQKIVNADNSNHLLEGRLKILSRQKQELQSKYFQERESNQQAQKSFRNRIAIMEEQLKQLHKKVIELQGQLQLNKERNLSSQQKILHLKQVNQELEINMQRQRNAIKKLRESQTNQQDCSLMIQSLEKNVKVLELKNKQLECSNEKLRLENQEIQTKLQETSSQLRQEIHRGEQKCSLSNADRKNCQQKTENYNLQQIIEQLKQESQYLREQFRKRQLGYTKAISRMQNTIKQSDVQRQKKQQQVKALNREIKELQRSKKQVEEQKLSKLEKQQRSDQKRQVDWKNIQMKRLQQANTDLEESNIRVLSEISTLKNKHQSEKANVEQLKQRILDLEQSLVQDKRIDSENVRTHKKEILQLRQNLHLLEEQKDLLKKQLAKAKDQLQSGMNIERNQQAAKTEGLEKQLKATLKQLFMKTEQLSMQERNVVRLEAESQQNILNKQAIQRELGKYIASLKKLQTSYSSLQQSCASKVRQLDFLEKNMQQNRSDLQQGRQQNRKLSHNNQILNQELQFAAKKIRQIQLQNNQVYTNLNRKLKSKQDQLVKLDCQKQIIVHQNSQIKLKFQGYVENNKALTDQNREMKTQIKGCLAEMDQLEAKLIETQYKYKELEAAYLDTGDKHKIEASERKYLIDQQIEILKRQFIQDRHSLSLKSEDQIKTLIKEIELLQEKNAQLKSQLQISSMQKQELLKMVSEIQTELKSHFQQQREKYQRNIKSMDMEIQNLRQRNRALLDYNAEKQADINAVRTETDNSMKSLVRQYQQIQLQLQAQIQKNQRTSNLLIQLQECQQRLQTNQASNEQYRIQIDQSRENVAILNKKMLLLDHDLAQAKLEREKYFKESQGLSQLVLKQETLIESNQQAQKDNQKKINQLTHEINALKTTLQQLRPMYEQNLNKLAELQKSNSTVEELNRNLEKINYKFKCQLQEKSVLANDNKNLQIKQQQLLSEAKSKIKELQQLLRWKTDQLKQNRDKYQRKIDEKEAQIIKLENDSLHICQKNKQLIRNLQGQKQQKRDLERKLQRSQRLVEDYENQQKKYKSKREEAIKEQQAELKLERAKTKQIGQKYEREAGELKRRFEQEMATFKADYEILYLKYEKYKEIAKVHKERIEVHRTVTQNNVRMSQQILLDCQSQLRKHG